MNARLAQENMITKTNFNNSISSLNSRNVANKTKNESIENELKKAKRIWFELFYWQKSLWRRWHTKLFGTSATEQIF